MKEAILQVVNFHSGIRGVDLSLSVIERRYPRSFNKDEYDFIINELVISGEIFELRYVDLSQPNITKYLYFRKDTVFLNLKGGDGARDPDKTIMDGESKRDT